MCRQNRLESYGEPAYRQVPAKKLLTRVFKLLLTITVFAIFAHLNFFFDCGFTKVGLIVVATCRWRLQHCTL